MPTARQAHAAPKRQKTTQSDLTSINAADCATHDALVDLNYPLERIEEHLLRLLTYESTEGIGEVVSLLLRSSGCSVAFSITGVRASAEDIVSEAEAIEELCLESPAGCPSVYDMQRVAYAKRVRALLVSVAQKLHEADNGDVVPALAKYTAVFSSSRLQSLRFTSTLFTGCLAEALSSNALAAPPLLRALHERSADVSPLVRKTAVTELANSGDVGAAVRAFNDPVGSVRLAAVRAVSSHAELEDAALDRMVQLAQQDVELGVRRSALKFLATNALDYDVDLCDMLVDADAQSRNSAALFVVGRLARNVESACGLLLSLASDAAPVLMSSSSENATSAIVYALDRQKQKFKVDWLEELGNLLTRDLLKDARSARLSSERKKQLRDLATKLDDLDMQRNLLVLYAGMASAGSSASGASLLNALPSLILKVRYDDELLARALSIASYLPSETLLERPDSEQQMQRLFRQILELLSERSTPVIAKAASAALAALPDSHRVLLLRDAYHDLRLKFATYLGPRGNVDASSSTNVNHVITQLLVLARFVDISDLVKLPIWPLLMQGNGHMRQLVRALGMKGSSEIAEQCVEKLMVIPSGPAVDEILQIYVSAKMRGVDLSQLPFDINERPPTKENVWTAAVAAGVI